MTEIAHGGGLALGSRTAAHILSDSRTTVDCPATTGQSYRFWVEAGHFPSRVDRQTACLSHNARSVPLWSEIRGVIEIHDEPRLFRFPAERRARARARCRGVYAREHREPAEVRS